MSLESKNNAATSSSQLSTQELLAITKGWVLAKRQESAFLSWLGPKPMIKVNNLWNYLSLTKGEIENRVVFPMFWGD